QLSRRLRPALPNRPPLLQSLLSRPARPPSSPPFPYTTLFRSVRGLGGIPTHLPLPLHLRAEGEVRGEPARQVRGNLLAGRSGRRSEEHTSELQSLTNLVCRLLLEKKNNACPHTAAPDSPAALA